MTEYHPRHSHRPERSSHAYETSSGFGADLREVYIRKEMDKMLDSFTENCPLTLCVATWNVNAKKPRESLEPWLKTSTPGDAPDLYAVGLQEIVDLNAGNLLVEHREEEPWLNQIRETICKGNNKYILVLSNHLVGIMLSVWVKEELFERVSESIHAVLGVGVMSIGGNKGGVGIRLKIFNTTLCFVCTHLAAHKHNIAGRNSDFHNILKKLKFGISGDDQAIPLRNHDYVFWLGDLNYRLNLNDMDEVIRLAEAGELNQLLANDQLLLEKKAGTIFKGWNEGKIEFPPTYKYEPGTSNYLNRADKKKRIPAWCDRVLWMDTLKEAYSVKLIDYYATNDLLVSDHKPVAAVFEVVAKVIIQDKMQDVYNLVAQKYDDLENEKIPKVNIFPPVLDFESVYYDEPVDRIITIQNTGQVIVPFQFAPKLDETHYCKQWMTISPHWGYIDPGESVEVVLTIHITKETASTLNCGMETLEDIIVMRVNAREKSEENIASFIQVLGNYKKSCFGSDAEFLITLSQPVRDYLPPSPRNSGDPPAVLSIPKELWRIADYIYTNSMNSHDMFSIPGDAVEMSLIREALDTGNPFPVCSEHSMAETMLVFLGSLPKPIFPVSLCAQYEPENSLTTWCRQSLLQLPLIHYNIFIYVISFLREFIKRSNGEVSADRLIGSFGGVLMRVEQSQLNNQADYQPYAILRHFLTSQEFA